MKTETCLDVAHLFNRTVNDAEEWRRLMENDKPTSLFESALNHVLSSTQTIPKSSDESRKLQRFLGAGT